MGLRVNFNAGTLGVLRNLSINERLQNQAIERLTTGLKINRASDNPSGFMLLSNLTSELKTISQAVENTQRAINLVNTADAGVEQISEQLINLKSLAVEAMNTGTQTSETISALQFAMDSNIGAINRIAGTTRFSDTNLLNGQLSISVTNSNPQLSNFNITSSDLADGSTVTINVSQSATRGSVSGNIASTQTNASTIKINGPLGSVDINIAANSTRADVVELINQNKDTTGVEATDAGQIRTTEVGSNKSVNLQFVSGAFSGPVAGLYSGTDVVAQVNGQTTQNTGNVVKFQQPNLSGEVTINADTTGNFQFTINSGGAKFQIGSTPSQSNQVSIGIKNLSAFNLGATGGVGSLNSLVTGGANSLISNPVKALNIIDSAINEVNTVRSQLGSIESRLLQTNTRNLGQAFDSISASRSSVGDSVLPEEVSNLLRSDLLKQVGIGTLRNLNLAQGSILNLLT